MSGLERTRSRKPKSRILQTLRRAPKAAKTRCLRSYNSLLRAITKRSLQSCRVDSKWRGALSGARSGSRWPLPAAKTCRIISPFSSRAIVSTSQSPACSASLISSVRRAFLRPAVNRSRTWSWSTPAGSLSTQSAKLLNERGHFGGITFHSARSIVNFKLSWPTYAVAL